MQKNSPRAPRRREALSRDVIVNTAIDLLDVGGEAALTMRALTERLGTGYGALYHHVADRSDLLGAATDFILGGIGTDGDSGDPQRVLRGIAVGVFDVVVAHPWIGAELIQEQWRPALLDIYESVSSELRAIGVPQSAMSDSVGVLVNYIFGVAGQNAANARVLAANGMDRAAYLAGVAARWAQLDPSKYPSVNNTGKQLLEHDDRAQFLAGIDIILAGIKATIDPAAGNSTRPLSDHI